MSTLFPLCFAHRAAGQRIRPMHRFIYLRLAALSFVALLTGLRLSAVTPIPFTESASFSFRMDGACAASMNLHDETGSAYVVAYGAGAMIDSDIQTALLRPGKTYTLDMWSGGPTNYLMSFIAPNGYAVYIDGVQTDLVQGYFSAGWNVRYYNVELRPAFGSGGGWGAFSGIDLGKSVAWSVGLGDLRTGRSAGAIQFREPDLSSSPASRSRLYYASPPANIGQIVVVKDGPSNQTLRQIVTPIGFTDLVDVSGGYEIRFYFWNQVSSWNGTLYTFSGSPWRTIKVESPAGNQLKITETEGTVVRVSNLTGNGNSGVTGGTITTSGGYTIHTFSSSGTLNVGGSITGVDYLVVGGGGGGGGYTLGTGGGGGAGSVEVVSGQTLPAGSLSVIVGAGGNADTNGSNSFFNGTTAYGGGHGGNDASGGVAGGSGGGAVVNNNTGAQASSGKQGSNTFYGGSGDNGSHAWEGGGGGGAGGAGHGIGEGASTGLGGPGLVSSISGSAVTYAAGGSGGINTSSASGIGGAGGNYTNATDGAPNTGSGGGGAYHGTTGKGGSGVVIVRYPTANAGNFTWTLKEGDGGTVLRTTTHTWSSPASGQRDDVVEIRTGGDTGTVVAKTKFHYVTQGWGEELDSVTANPDGGANALTTTYTYHTNGANPGNYRKVKSVTQPTGNWTAWEYYDDWDRRGQLKYQYQPFLDAPATAAGASATTGRVAYYEYVADWTGRYSRPTLREERVNNVVTAKTTWSHGDNTGSGEPRAYATVNSYRDATNYYSDYVESYRADADPDFAGQLYQAKSANLAHTAGSISRGTFNTSTKAFAVGSTGDHWRELRFHGSTSATGAESVSSFNSQSCPAVYLIPNKSTLDVTIRIAQGYLYRTEQWIYTGGGNFDLMMAEDFEYDATGHLTQRWVSTGNGALSSWSFTNGRLTSSTDATGIQMQYTAYDALGRLTTSVKKGAPASGSYAAQSDISTTVSYDGADRVTQTVVTGGTLSLTSSSTYDLAGRATSTTAPGGYVTSFGYTNGGRTVTTTLPSAATKIEDTYLDGGPRSLGGTAVVNKGWTKWVASDGTIATSEYLNAAWHITYTNWLGAKLYEWWPGGNGANRYEYYNYSSSGQLLYILHSDGRPSHYFAYDTLGQLVREGDDLNGNGVLDLASSDRITDYNAYYFKYQSGWYLEKTTKVYATAGSATPTQITKQNWQLSNLPVNTLSSSYAYDVFGNATVSVRQVDRANKLVTDIVSASDSSVAAQQVTRNGLAASSRSKTNLTTTFSYDALGRLTSSVDPRIGADKTVYISGTSLVDKFYDAYATARLNGTPAVDAPTTTYHYDSAGRVDWIADALGKKSYTAYTARSEVYRQWGDAAIPVEYAYDIYGRRTTMKTFRGGTGWTGSTWPASPGTADTTTWNYQDATGLLSSKVDATGKSVDYTYTQIGQVATRQWARYVSGTSGPRVTTTYAYFSTGELSGVTYNDGTPSLSYTYNRLGNTDTVADATGTRSFAYNLAGTLELQYEDLPAFYDSRRVGRGYDTSAGVVGRYNRFYVTNSSKTYDGYDTNLGYDTYGRPTTFVSGIISYSYVPNSNLVQSLTSGWFSGYSWQRSYEPNRDLVNYSTTSIGATVEAQFAYSHDVLGRTDKTTRTGALYARYGNGTQGLDVYYGYDDRSQVTSAITKLAGTATVLTGRDDAYGYDNFGNRASSAGTAHNGNSANYTTNALNQYTQRTVPGVTDIAGAATAGTTVTIASSGGPTDTATRHGQYFFDSYPLSNSSAIYKALTVSDGTNSVLTNAFLPATPEAFTYDLDGNLTSDGRWDYAYDAENRLVAMQTHAALSPSPFPNADARRLEFKYDYLGRRVEKLVRTGYNGSAFTTVAAQIRNVYDGWNLLLELNALGSLAKIRGYVWGLDLSGSAQGAGGVGGLVYMYDFATSSSYYPAYDAMGNIHAMIRSDGVVSAEYEYDAFGQTIRESGPLAASFPFRFSTKYTDLDTGLVYYGLRYYSPSLGRFINRDPKEEDGGLNLYAFCRNNGINAWDYLGMDEVGSESYWRFMNAYNAAQLNSMTNFYTQQSLSAQMMQSVALNAQADAARQQTIAEGRAIAAGTINNWSNGTVAGYMSGVVDSNLNLAFAPVQTAYNGLVAQAGATLDAAGAKAYATTQSYDLTIVDIPNQHIATGLYDSRSPSGLYDSEGRPIAGNVEFAAAAAKNTTVSMPASSPESVVNTLRGKPTPSAALFTHGDETGPGIGHYGFVDSQWAALNGTVDNLYLCGCELAKTPQARNDIQKIANLTGATVYASPFKVNYTESGTISTKYWDSKRNSENGILLMYKIAPNPKNADEGKP